MFGKAKLVSSATDTLSDTTLISRETIVTGNISFTGSVHIEGTIKGNITTDEGLLTVANSGSIEGDVRAQRVVIDGHIHGNVLAEAHLELASRSVINGNVYYCVIEMAKGAQVNGSLQYHDSFDRDQPLLAHPDEPPASLGELLGEMDN